MILHWKCVSCLFSGEIRKRIYDLRSFGFFTDQEKTEDLKRMIYHDNRIKMAENTICSSYKSAI